MRILYPAGTKREWIDRNPVIWNYQWSGNVAPHAWTVRITYTVPTNKKAFMQFAMLYANRTAAAAPVGLTMVELDHNNGATTCVPVQNVFQDNTLNVPRALNYPFLVYLMAGHTLSIQTQDLSTGGTITYVTQFSVVEFDA